MTAKHAAQHSKKKAPAQPSIDASRGLMQSESACAPANSQSESHAGIYLQRAHIAAFGRFIDRTLGPFKPGLNVVYGPNEAGKTTARAFVGGVLFGWPEARGSRNAYKPRAKVRFCSATRQRARWAAFRALAMRKASSATMRGLRRCAAISTAKRSKRSSRLMPMSFAPSRRRPTFRRNCSRQAQELKKVLLMWLPPWMRASRRL